MEGGRKDHIELEKSRKKRTWKKLVLNGVNWQKSERKAFECSKQSKQCRLTKASESVREIQEMTSGSFCMKHSYRQSDQIERLRPKCAFNGRLGSLYLIQWKRGATASYEQGEICTRQWLRLSLTAVCKIKCWQSFLCSLAQLCRDAGTKLWWWKE